VVSFTPWPLYYWYPLDRRLGGPEIQSGRGVEEKNSQLPPGFGSRSSTNLKLKLQKLNGGRTVGQI